MTLFRMAFAALTLAFGLGALSLGASAQNQPAGLQLAQNQVAQTQDDSAAAEEDPVVARVNGEEIRRSAVFQLASTLPQQFQQQMLQIYPLLVQRLVDFKLANAAGRADGLADDEEVQRRLDEMSDRIIREVWIERAVEARITDEALKAKYDDHVKANPPATEFHARHILVETEEEARKVIGELDGGADFVELAKERSTGPSGPRGGDLGYFRGEQMVPEFSAAAQALEPGKYSSDPVQTQFGWHVIKLEDQRETAPPAFAELEPQLREELTRENVEGVLADLRGEADVEITPAGTSFVPEVDSETGAGAAQ